MSRERDAGALVERCRGCWRTLAPYLVEPAEAGIVAARYACRCSRLWTSSWPITFLPAGSPLRGTS